MSNHFIVSFKHLLIVAVDAFLVPPKKAAEIDASALKECCDLYEHRNVVT